jgi:hypothetical protein
MTRLAQCSLALVLFGVPLLLVGCGSVSITKLDAASGSPDGSASTTDLPNVLVPDAGLDLAPSVPPDGPVFVPDAGVDKLPVASEVGPVVPPDGSVDSIPVAGEVGSLVTPDAAVDKLVVTMDTGPLVTIDSPVDGQADAADAGDSADDAGDATDSLPLACEFQGGSVLSDLTLYKACSPYNISEYILVNGGAVLTIQPGVTLNFAGGVGIAVGNEETGKLVAIGTEQDPITFTSASSPPLPGDWGAIRLLDGTLAGTKIAYAMVDACGGDRNGCIVGDGVSPNTVTIDHVTLARVGPDANGIVEWNDDSNFVITNSTFNGIADDRYAISLQAPSFAGIGAGNTFNDGAMIEINGGTISSTTSWVDPGTAIAVTDSLWIQGMDSPVLTINAGVTLMFAPANDPLQLSVGYGGPGTLVLAGSPTTSKHVVLTSLSSSPDQGDWLGVQVWPNGTAQISYADISYGGSNGLSGGNLIVVNGNSDAEIVVDHSSFAYSRGYGIYVDCADMGVTPVATVNLNAGNTFDFNESDPTNTGNLSNNVGPGLDGSECVDLH